MKKHKSFGILIAVAIMISTACSKEITDKFEVVEKAPCQEDSKKSNVRIKNTSSSDYQNVTVQSADGTTINYGTIVAGKTSCYSSFAKIYRYAAVKLSIAGKEHTLQPIDYVGETPLGIGKFTYALDFDAANSRLNITTTND